MPRGARSAEARYRRDVHPIEHLRYVARAQGADPASLVEETAHALGSLRFDPSGLVVACRRIVQRHPFTGALWWLCSNVSTSAEPFDAVWELADRIRSDRTGAELAAALPDDVTVVTIGAPDVIGDGLIRRGDVRVLALDAAHTATSFVRRLERHDVDYEPVDAGAAGHIGVEVGAEVHASSASLLNPLDRRRCAAAFAIVADGQARGKKDALAYPALDQRGREFFVRSSARVMDDTGMDRAAVAAALQAEAKDLWDKDAIGQIMPSCLLLLEASGV